MGSEDSRGDAQHRKKDKILALIAIFKLLKSILLLGAGVAALQILRPTVSEAIHDWAETVSFQIENDSAQRLLAMAARLTPGRAAALGLAAFAYAALFAVEGVGLWMGKRWAEYLTVIATGSLIPFEIYEIFRKFSAPRLLALILNVAVVIYLIYRIQAKNGRSPN